jgi:phosphatidylserine decarboxylase
MPVDRLMTLRALRAVVQQEDLNFLLTNRVPRIALTRLMGRLSRIRSPLLCRLSLAAWRVFTDLDLSDAVPQRYESLHEVFTRELIPGARPVNPSRELVTSPCDAIVGACGPVRGTEAWQAKGFPYAIHDLFGPSQDPSPFRDGTFVTLRLTSAMYHRFHAPHDCTVEHVTYLSGDTWNVNPIALRRVERLFCRNERAVIRLRLREQGLPLVIVPVAAILVASMRLSFADVTLHLRYRGPNEIPCDAALAKGETMGWFEHGSTLIAFAPPGVALAEGIAPGVRIRMGEPLMRLPVDAA